MIQLNPSFLCDTSFCRRWQLSITDGSVDPKDINYFFRTLVIPTSIIRTLLYTLRLILFMFGLGGFHLTEKPRGPFIFDRTEHICITPKICFYRRLRAMVCIRLQAYGLKESNTFLKNVIELTGEFLWLLMLIYL